MPFSIELRFDDPLTERVRRWSEAVAALAGQPAGLAEPHVSLAVYDEQEAIDPGRLVAALDRLAPRYAPVPVTFASVGAFLTEESVLFLAPVVTARLLRLHHVYHSLASELRARCRPHYLPGNWVPHGTLGMFLPLSELLEAVGQLAAEWTPCSGQLRHVALVEDGARTLHERTFGDG